MRGKNGKKAKEKNDKEIIKQVASSEASGSLIKWFVWFSLGWIVLCHPLLLALGVPNCIKRRYIQILKEDGEQGFSGVWLFSLITQQPFGFRGNHHQTEKVML